jgi:DNA-directed RNA polymerase subunit K/omega
MPNATVLESFAEVAKGYDASKNTTMNILSKYEKTKIIGMRLEQLSRGASPTIDYKALKLNSIREIAFMELKERVLPFMIVRTLPCGLKEYWKLEDMIITGL